MASWHEAFPDFLFGSSVGLIQLIVLAILLNKLKIDNLKDGAVFGLVYIVVL